MYITLLCYITGRTYDSSAPNFPLLSARIWKRFQFSTGTLRHIHDGVDVMMSLILLLISCTSLSLLLHARCFNLTPEPETKWHTIWRKRWSFQRPSSNHPMGDLVVNGRLFLCLCLAYLRINDHCLRCHKKVY
jgi:hypothetical protein